MKAIYNPQFFTVIGVLLFSCLLHTVAANAQTEVAPGEFVTLNGFQMYYETYGTGEPLVLLHYFGASMDAWEPFLPEFANRYRVIAVDLRGHGRSTNPGDRFTHRQAALDVYALLDTLGIERFKAVGLSTGGMTLLHMATQQPSRIEAMVLVGATSYFPEQARSIMETSIERQELGDDETMHRLHKYGEAQIQTLYRQFTGFKDSYDDMNFTGPYLSTITARTLIVHGDRDEIFPVEIPFEMYRYIPNAALWIVPEGDHIPVYKPEVPFVATALRFLGLEGI